MHVQRSLSAFGDHTSYELIDDSGQAMVDISVVFTRPLRKMRAKRLQQDNVSYSGEGSGTALGAHSEKEITRRPGKTVVSVFLRSMGDDV